MYYTTLIAVAVLAYWYIYRQLVTFDNWQSVLDKIVYQPGAFITVILIQLLLLVLNLTLESAKWHLLLKQVHQQKFRTSMVQVLGGMASAAATPARLGEPAGRLLGVPKGKRVSAVTLSLAGSFMQNVVIFVAGITGLCYLLDGQKIAWDMLSIQRYVQIIFVMAIVFVFAAFLIVRYSSRFRWLWNHKQLLRMLLLFKGMRWLRPLLLTFLRHFCFSFQFIVWLLFFDIDISISAMIGVVLSYFLMITVIPSFALVDLGIRGSVAVFLFSAMGVAAGPVVIATFMLWLVNIGVPAIGGSVLLITAGRSRFS
jgi:hypothetical protein